MANAITSCRIVCSILLLFVPTFSPAFYTLYIMAGITDMIYGTVARKTGTDSQFGAKLDSVADFVFVAVCLVKILPAITIPQWIWVWIGITAVIKLINVVSGFAMQKTLVVEHTLMNKVTGVLLFVLPLTLPLIDIKYSGIVVAAVATFAAIQEGHYIRTGRVEE